MSQELQGRLRGGCRGDPVARGLLQALRDPEGVRRRGERFGGVGGGGGVGGVLFGLGGWGFRVGLFLGLGGVWVGFGCLGFGGWGCKGVLGMRCTVGLAWVWGWVGVRRGGVVGGVGSAELGGA